MVAPGVPHTESAADRVVFGGVVLLLVGVLSVIQGVAALAGSAARADADLIVSDSSTWGTALVVLGGAAGLIAVSLWAGAGTRSIAVAVAGANAIVQLLFMPAYPFWSLAVFALDLLATLALVTGTQPQHERSHRE